MSRGRLEIAKLNGEIKICELESRLLETRLESIKKQRVSLAALEGSLKNTLCLYEAKKIDLEHDLGRLERDYA